VITDPLAEALGRTEHNPPTPRLDIQPWSSTSSTQHVMEAEAAPVPEQPRKTQRLLSLDAFRGVIMLLMASGGFGIPALAKKFPDTIWATIAPYLEHVKWTGGVPWDMIQPSFMFMVGVAMPFSYANRMERGASSWELFFHALGRALVLVLLGVLCASGAKDSTNWAFTNVLAQIGLGYVFLFLLWRSGTWGQVLGTLCILVGYWTWFAGTPALPPAASAYPEGVLTGDFAHWNMNANPAATFDVWFLNLFPRTTPFTFSEGGYQTLNFIPSIATMCLGLMAGRFLRTDRPAGHKVASLICAGGVLIALGLVAGEYACPIVKRIWTPSWVLYSGGIATTLLAVFYLEVEVVGARWLAWPFAVIGMNSILVYLLSQFSKGWIKDRLHQHLEPDLFTGAFAPMIESAMVLGVIWILCWWLYRQRAFLRI
jgi:predicted acyltransferase